MERRSRQRQKRLRLLRRRDGKFVKLKVGIIVTVRLLVMACFPLHDRVILAPIPCADV